MSSLGLPDDLPVLNALPDVSAERAFLPDDARARAPERASRCAPTNRARPVGDFPIVAFSLAYELELAGAGRLPRARRHPGARRASAPRAPPHPLIVIGGPLTFSNPMPAAPFADVILHGRGRGAAARARRRRCATSRDRAALLGRPGDAPGLLRAVAPRRAAARRSPGAADEQAAGLLADPHAAHRARATCS